MKDELDKCIVLCSNCHRELHDKQDGSYLEPERTFGTNKEDY